MPQIFTQNYSYKILLGRFIVNSFCMNYWSLTFSSNLADILAVLLLGVPIVAFSGFTFVGLLVRI